jgi:hypothetical protein
MSSDVHKVSLARFVAVAELLDHAFPKAVATPDYLSHDCERAEEALLSSIGRTGMTDDKVLAELFSLQTPD